MSAIDAGSEGSIQITKSTVFNTHKFPTKLLIEDISLLEPNTDPDDKPEFYNVRRELKIKAGKTVGLFYSVDGNSDEFDGWWKLYGEVTFLEEGVIIHDSTESDASGEVSQYQIDLDDHTFIADGGEFSIITKKNQINDELTQINKVLGTKYTAIILSNS